MEPGTNNNQEVPALENMIDVLVYSIQAVKSFGELPIL